ncbi:MAG: hypothetical protein RI949_482 [Pseudomonadota bacterium]|jgi:hypothetical protein
MKTPGLTTAKRALCVALGTLALVASSGVDAQTNKDPKAANATKATKATKPAVGASAAGMGAAGAKADPAPTVTLPAATQASYERELDAIRSALLQTTVVEAPTRVVSTAWVDDKGALRELSHFQSEAHVRGVRVTRYVEDESAPAEKKDAPQVKVDVLPWSLRVAKSGCEDPPRAWRLPLQVQSSLSTGFNGSQLYASTALLEMAQTSWLAQMKQSTRWRAFESRAIPTTQYERYLTGPYESYQGWVAHMRLHPQVAPEARPTSGLLPFFKTVDPNYWSWTLSLTLSHTGKNASAQSDTVPVRLERTVHIPLPQSLHDPAAWMRSLQGAINATLSQWVQLLDDRLRCEPPQFAVEGTAAVLTVQAGQGSGLRHGDRVLVVNRTEVPSRMLEAGARAPMALAEVVQVGVQSSRLRHLAGPMPTREGDWVALPL